MGAFYTSHTLRGPSQAEVLEYLKDRSAFVSRLENGFVTVLDEASEGQDSDVLAELACALSERFRCPVLAVLNHDDDVLYFELYEDGVKSDEYNSSPGYFGEEVDDEGPTGGNAACLAAACGVTNAAAVEAVLRSGEYVFAQDRHRDLAAALALPAHSVGIGYIYATEGEFPPGVADDVYAHTGE